MLNQDSRGWRVGRESRFVALGLLVLGLVMLCGCPPAPNPNTPVPGQGTVVIEPMPVELEAPWSLERADLRTDHWEGTGLDSLHEMHSGSYTVNWGDVDGYVVLAGAVVTQELHDDETITFEVTYVLPWKDIIIDMEPDVIEAGWYVDGPSFHDGSGDGDGVLEEMPPGEYAIEWGDATGYVTPPGSTAVHTDVSDLVFQSVYVPE